MRFYFLFVLFFQSFANAQSVEKLTPIESLRINQSEVRKTPWSISTSFEMPAYTLLLSTNAGRINSQQISQRIQFSPTVGPNIGITAQRDQWLFGFSRKFSFLSEEDERKFGRTKYEDWRLGYEVSENVLIEGFYQNYQGFYTDLSGEQGFKTEIGPAASSAAGTQSGTIINRSDMRAMSYGLRATAALNLMPFVNLFNMGEKSAPSDWQMNLLGKVYYNRQGITGDSPLIPEASANSFSPVASLKEFWSNSFGVGAGMGCVVNMSPSAKMGFDATLGGGFQRQTHVFSDRESTAYTFAQEMNAKLYFSGGSDTHQFRGDLYMDTLSSKVDEINLDATSLGARALYTYSGF